ncbi:MAG: hypothetical protein Q7K29_08395 [Thermoleophilia bacterium]|nr:hypothetical protein [Thermoleophilia bacterium]
MELKNKQKIATIFRQVANDIADLFPYLFAFYIIALVFAVIFPSWRYFFSWSALHASIALFALISLFGTRGSQLQQELRGTLHQKGMKTHEFSLKHWRVGIQSSLGIWKMVCELSRTFCHMAYISCRHTYAFFRTEVIRPLWTGVIFAKEQLRLSDYIRIGVIIVICVYVLSKGVDILNFTTLLLGLISILYCIDARISAGIALVFLAICPILLAVNQDVLAEKVAVFAYYGLVITVLTSISELIRDRDIVEGKK